MATIRKRGDRWQVQIRRKGCSPLSKTFVLKRDADLWARNTEAQADRAEFPLDKEQYQDLNLTELVCRYRDEITPRKKGYSQETYRLNAFLRHPICQRKVLQVSTSDFAQYRDDRLQVVTPKSLKTELAPIHNMFEVARDEWGIPITENPLDKLRLKYVDQRRERRLKDGELDRIISEAQKCKNPLVVSGHRDTRMLLRYAHGDSQRIQEKLASGSS